MRLPFYPGWAIVAIVFVTIGVGVNARTAFSLLFPPILAEFGWSRGATAGAFSFGFAVAACASPLMGRAMDRFGPRMVMETGTALMGAGLLLASQVDSLWLLYLSIGVLVGGGSVSLGYSGQSQFLPNWFVRRRGLALGIAFSGVGVGSVTLLPWVQWTIEREGWRSACWWLGVGTIAALAPINLLLRKRPEDIGWRPDGDAEPRPGAPPPPSNVVDPAWVAVEWTLGRAVRTARFWWVSAAFFGGLYVWYAVQVHQTRYLTEIGFDAGAAVWALGFVSLAGIPGQIALGWLSDRIGREWVWGISCLGFALCYLLLLWLGARPSAWALWAMVIAQGALGYGMTSVMGAIVAEIFGGKHMGAIFGMLMLAALAGGAAGPWATGALHDLAGDYVAAFWLAAALGVASAAAMWVAAPRRVRAVAGRVSR